MIRVASHVLALAATAAVIALPTGTAAQDTLAVEVEEDREEAEEERVVEAVLDWMAWDWLVPRARALSA